MESIKVAKVDDVEVLSSGQSSRGAVHITQHHLIVHSDQNIMNELWLPYPMISLVTRMPLNVDGVYPILIHTRNFRSYTLRFSQATEAMDVFESIRGLTVATTVNQLYAFFYSPSTSTPQPSGWDIYSPRAEFARMGVGSRTKAWRFTDINKDYKFCPTYPARMVVPTKISDSTLQYASKYRSKCRIPTLSYLHWANFGTITRSSQPMVGLTNNRSIQDEKLIEAIFQSHHSPETRISSGPIYGATATNLIIDARPTTNAMANVAKGAGSENMDHYRDGKKAYLGIDNIHVMRDSLNKVVEALRESDSTTLSTLHTELSDVLSLTLPKASLNRDLLRRSGWLRHLSTILDGTLLIVRNVHVNSSHVLIHCSDGWDRTAQLSSLAQICLDPYYRTMKGLQVLIEKDYLAFGHRFMDRCGHLSSEKIFLTTTETPSGGGAEVAHALFASVQNKLIGQGHLKETSPVFHQFLECVRQIQLQFPARFEFNGRFLETIFYHLYSCQFGTFLYNCERERKTGEGLSPPPCERTHSIWDFLNTPEEVTKHTNPDFDPKLDDPAKREKGADMGVLFPDPQKIRFWYELYGREDDELNGTFTVLDGEGAGADMTGPVEGSDENLSSATIRDNNGGITVITSANQTPPRSMSSTPSLANSVESDRRALSPLSASLWSSQSSAFEEDPARPRSRAAGGMTSNVNTSTYPRAGNELRMPWTMDASQQQELIRGIGGGAKSMWGRLSSSASTAFTAVQGTYGEVAREVRGMATTQSWTTGNEADGKELQSRIGPLKNYGDASGDAQATWGGSALDQVITPSWAADTQVPTDRWKTERVTQGLSSLSLENPWQTLSGQSERQIADQTRETSLSTSGQGLERSHAMRSLDPQTDTTPKTTVDAASPVWDGRDSDPLGVL